MRNPIRFLAPPARSPAAAPAGAALALSLVFLLVAAPGAPGAAATAPSPPDFQEWLEGPVRVLLTPEEQAIAGTVDSSAEADAFKRWFWERRDPTPSTLANEFREQFEARLSYVIKEFGRRDGDVPGWATAPGTIYLLLGSPQRTGRGSKPVIAGGEFATLTVWMYEDVEGASLAVPFVDLRDGVHLALDRGDRQPQRRLRRVLESVRRSAVRQPELPWNRPHQAEVSPDLPLEAAWSAPVGGGLLVGGVLRPDRLYGKPRKDGLRFHVTVEDERETLLGALVFEYRTADMEEWADHRVHILVWLPREILRGDEVVLREKETGRTVRLPSGVEERGDLPGGDRGRLGAVARLLGVGALAEDGVAVAYLEPCDRGHAIAAWLSAREPDRADARDLLQAGSPLRLVSPDAFADRAR